jgi:hypothetical protein
LLAFLAGADAKVADARALELTPEGPRLPPTLKLPPILPIIHPPSSQSQQTVQRNPLRGFRIGAHLPVDGRDALDELAAVRMLQIQNLFQGPVEMVSDKGYLLEQAFKGVA